MAFMICIAALIIMMFVFTKMLLSFGNNSSAAVESVDATVVEDNKCTGLIAVFYGIDINISSPSQQCISSKS